MNTAARPFPGLTQLARHSRHRWSMRQWMKRLVVSGGMAVGMGAMVAIAPPKAVAAERFIVTFGPLTRSFEVSDLRRFAETGEQSPNIRLFLNLTNQDPEPVRAVLREDISMSLTTVDRITYSLPGEYALFQLGRRLHTRSRQANIQALRAALILSASDDNRVSLIEVLENYPTEALYLDGREVISDVRDLGEVIEVVNERIVPFLVAAQEFLAGIICECESAPVPASPTETVGTDSPGFTPPDSSLPAPSAPGRSGTR